MLLEIIRMFFTFAGNHPFLMFFTAPFWFVIILSPLALVYDVIMALIGAFKKP